MPSMALHIPSHIPAHDKNMQVSKKSQHPSAKTCDCQVAENCPLNRNWKEFAVIYQADQTREIDNTRIYIGITEDHLKKRLSDHCFYFR